MTLSVSAVLTVLTAGLLSTPLAADAQQPGKTYRIGYLGPGSTSVLPAALQAFRHELRERGYIEGQNLAIGIDGQEGETIGSTAETRNMTANRAMEPSGRFAARSLSRR